MSLISQVIKNQFQGWALKEYKPVIKANLDSFTMHFILAFSINHIYGVFAYEKTCNHKVFLCFLDRLIDCLDKIFKKKDI